MTLAAIDALIPSSPGSGFGGSWLGWYLRTLLSPVVGRARACSVVATTLGPGHDYAPAQERSESGEGRRVQRW